MKLWPWQGRRAAREQELNREIEWHLNEIREEREADALSPRQAAHAARRDFGKDVARRLQSESERALLLFDLFRPDFRRSEVSDGSSHKHHARLA